MPFNISCKDFVIFIIHTNINTMQILKIQVLIKRVISAEDECKKTKHLKLLFK